MGYVLSQTVKISSPEVDKIEEIAGMSLMGFGGLISVIGGLLFLIVAWKSMRGGRAAT